MGGGPGQGLYLQTLAAVLGQGQQWMECPVSPSRFPCDPPARPYRLRWGSDLGWDDVVSNIPEPLPKLRGVGEGHALDFGDYAAL